MFWKTIRISGEKGATGINGKQLVAFLNSSPAFKNLVPADMSTDTVNMMNLLLTLYLKPEQSGLKDEFIAYLKDVKKNRPTGNSIYSTTVHIIISRSYPRW